MKKRNVAVILAGGTGTRMGGSVPKQFIEYNGKTLIEYSLEIFQNHNDIDEIAIVLPAYSFLAYSIKSAILFSTSFKHSPFGNGSFI